MLRNLYVHIFYLFTSAEVCHQAAAKNSVITLAMPWYVWSHGGMVTKTSFLLQCIYSNNMLRLHTSTRPSGFFWPWKIIGQFIALHTIMAHNQGQTVPLWKWPFGDLRVLIPGLQTYLTYMYKEYSNSFNLTNSSRDGFHTRMMKQIQLIECTFAVRYSVRQCREAAIQNEGKSFCFKLHDSVI